MGTDADREGLMKLPLSYIETWGTRRAARGGRRHVRAGRRRPRARVRRRGGGALLGAAGAGRPGRPRGRHRAVLPGDGDGDAGDRRRREPSRHASRERLGARPGRASRAAPPEHEARRRQLPQQPDRLRARRGRRSASSWRCARARHPPVLRRGVPRHRARPGADHHAGRRPLRDRRLAQRRCPSRTACPGLRVGWLACRDRALLERLEKRKHYTTHLQRRARRSTWRRSPCAIARRSGRATAASSPPTGPFFDDFFARWAELFDWQPPMGGCVCFPRYKGGDVEDFCARLLRRRGRAGAAGEHVLLGDRRGAGRSLPRRNRQARPGGRRRSVRPVPAPRALRFFLHAGHFGQRWSVTCCACLGPDTWRKCFLNLLA